MNENHTYSDNVCSKCSDVGVTGLTMSASSATLWVNGTQNLSATIAPTNATVKTITWSSSNTSVATVSTAGVVTAIAKGTATITATSANGKTATCVITVKQQVTSVSLSSSELFIVAGKTSTITATATPTTANSTSVNWSSSDTGVATVSTSGVVTAKAKGTATITATAADEYGSKSTCTVTVIARGDVDGSGDIDNEDITGCVKFAMGDTDTDALYADAADYNNNGKVNTTDAIAIVRLALNGTTTYHAGAKGLRAESSTSNLLAVENIEMESGTTNDVAIRLTDTMDKFTSLMFDVTLPEGVTIDNVTVGSRAASHSSVYSQHEDGTVRVICYSLTNEEFTQTDGDIVKLTLKADKDVFDGIYDVNFRNIKLVRKNVTSLFSESENATLNIGGTTGLRSYDIGDGDMSATYHDGYLTIQAAKDGLATIYASSGALVYKNNLQAGEKVTVAVPRGVYIINGTKTAVK